MHRFAERILRNRDLFYHYFLFCCFCAQRKLVCDRFIVNRAKQSLKESCIKNDDDNDDVDAGKP